MRPHQMNEMLASIVSFSGYDLLTLLLYGLSLPCSGTTSVSVCVVVDVLEEVVKLVDCLLMMRVKGDM